ncbi:uncharacterized protein F4807DRAFT_129227 [Annulohypoxylon truncatum]|uniref:uncharacterized protein n=1 Tax=Annulohypoxylon truncatum TaxID=327061 RepID=UPI0020074E42|nr:uncharacterized protein F4807DRAFT_129227 [Annulohypoxylon truncatum]KAI1214468.1 hypothetical protein F4807DRAFT_129227 [Annulohypoxylon truncatum]
MSFPAEALRCEAIEGNPDFYGLGIRIGVYLQWVTAWVSLVVDPLSAQSVYDVNSVFVFAILVATMIATFADNPTIEPVETYIMLQFSLGFFVTTLSTFGLRLQFLRPRSGAQLIQYLGELGRAVKQFLQKLSSLLAMLTLSTLLATLRLLSLVAMLKLSSLVAMLESSSLVAMSRLAPGDIMGLPLSRFLPLKPYHLSWSGVFWRTTTVCMLAAVNIWLWFAVQPNYRLAGQTCDPPFVFFFSKQQLSGAIVGFFKAVSILAAIIVVPPFMAMFGLVGQIFIHTLMALYRDVLHFISPKAPELLKQRLNFDRPTFDVLDLPRRYIDVLDLPRGYIDILDFLSKPGSETYRFSHILKVIVYLGSAKATEKPVVNTREENGDMIPQHRAEFLARLLCLSLNIFVVLSIIWFILSVEFTLAWNDIRGVNSINSAGQLIPFVIGAVSTLQVMKKIILLGLAKKYKDWVDISEDVFLDLLDNQGIIKIRPARDTRETEHDGARPPQNLTLSPEDTRNNTDSIQS